MTTLDLTAPDPAGRDTAGAIRPGEVHVWHVPLDGVPRAGRDRFAAALGPQERDRRTAYRTPAARARYTVAHGALRLLLGHFLGIPAPDVRIHRGPLGKPELDPAAADAAPDLRFSLSHVHGRALVALTLGRAVGIDLDQPRPGFPLEAFARRYFPAPERDLVLSAGPTAADRERMFLRLWTRKEALVKAAGSRMALGVRQPVCGAAGPTSAPAQVRPRHPGLHGTWTVQNLPPPGAGPGPPSAASAAVAALALSGTDPYRIVTRTA
ncbi:4'-phosphopantetheinyl transferase superfamily protein [Streptomyces sp. NPDC032472]|uniref:4'-phosphopantetheinyl transferase family protein n=1 Tax=Streptomyces sp. NPDC032472 TaxID=3155018 RepID=UPI003401A25E